MHVSWSSRPCVYQGWFLSYELSEQFLKWKLFRCIPLSRIELKEIRSLRAGSLQDVMPRAGRKISRQLRSRYWPSLAHEGPHTARYLIERRNGGRILVRLEPGFHYRLRSAISAHTQAAQNSRS